MQFLRAMKWALVASFILIPAAADARANRPPLQDPVFLNIGLACQWQAGCMGLQLRAMDRALQYVSKRRPRPEAVQLCNRNASRKRSRVDWVGFDNCIRNSRMRSAATASKR